MFIKSLILDSTNKNTQQTKIYTLFYVRREHKKFDRKKYKIKRLERLEVLLIIKTMPNYLF